jgi:hypothetical protein
LLKLKIDLFGGDIYIDSGLGTRAGEGSFMESDWMIPITNS